MSNSAISVAVDRHHHGQVTDPTPSQIRAACLRIQREWSAAERRRRAGASQEGVLSPLIPVVRLRVPEKHIA